MEENPPATELPSAWKPGRVSAGGEQGSGPGPVLASPAKADAALTHAVKAWDLSSQPSTAPAPAPAKLNCFLQRKKSFGE